MGPFSIYEQPKLVLVKVIYTIYISVAHISGKRPNVLNYLFCNLHRQVTLKKFTICLHFLQINLKLLVVATDKALWVTV